MELIFKLAAPVFAGLVFLTNIITESVKKIKENVNAKLVALLSAIILSVIAVEATAIYLAFSVWYYYAATAVGGIVLGFIIAQVAETGYDSAYMQFVEILKTIIKAVLGAKDLEENEDTTKDEIIVEKSRIK